LRKLRGLLFDLDGTLIDSAEANHAAYARALREVGAVFDTAEVARRAAGRQWRQFVPELLSAAGIACDAGDVARRKGELYREVIGELRLNVPLLALASSVRPALKTALVTTASALNVQAILGHFALLDAFDVVMTGDDVSRHKPDPEAYLMALARLALGAEDCVAFEDSDVGVASATAAGIAVVRVAFGD
jgi:beta-phosphoglucomutase-like phosphatase (HAD superfamily)